MKPLNAIGLVSIVLTLFSCEDNYDMSQVEYQTTSDAVIETTDVSTEEASKVAVSFFNKKGVPETRCSSYEISRVYDKSGSAAMYVVNFANDGGFVLVSATKNFNPILAYSETGNYDVNGLMPPALYQWQNSMAETVTCADELPSDSTIEYRSMWSEYLPQENVQINAPITTRAIEGDMVKAQLILQDSVMAWSRREGYTVLQITGSITGDKETDEQIRDLVPGGIYPPYQEEWERLSVVLRRPHPTTKVKNFVQSTWDQNNGYNDAYNRINGMLPPAGCGPVALGQIMRYYEYPKSYNWNAMPYNAASYTTSELLYDIAIAANADINLSGTGVTESNMLNALKHFGYKYTESTDHDEDKVWREIDAKRPVCMMGMFESLNTGHAWIATGGTITKSGYIYDVYTFRNRFDFVPMYKYESTGGRFIYYFYMNWGWNGDYNAYYLDIDKDPIHNDDITGRRNIYGIEPNN